MVNVSSRYNYWRFSTPQTPDGLITEFGHVPKMNTDSLECSYEVLFFKGKHHQMF